MNTTTIATSKTINYVDEELGGALKAVSESIDDENFDGFMEGVQHIRAIVYEGGALRGSLSLVDRMLELCASKYVQQQPEKIKTGVVRVTSLLFQLAMVAYLREGKN